jgi:peptidoglycan/LPS O-acetylase OafA/YrhL
MVKTYYPKLDGLRGYAVISVLLFHLNIHYHLESKLSYLFFYGWLGVQVFFVLSGFLITNILLESKKSNNYFKSFYIRRTLRIFPIYYILFTLMILYSLLTRLEIKDYPYYIFYSQNYLLALHFWAPKFPTFFNHTWSLAVEEQFYLIWPLLVFYLNKKTLVPFCFFLISLAICAKIYISFLIPGNPICWTNLISNFDFLIGGGLIAIFIRNISIAKIKKYLIYIVILTIILYFIICKSFNIHLFWKARIDLTLMEGHLFLLLTLPIILLTLVNLIDEKIGLFSFLFSNNILLFIGKISYGVYLYHNICYFMVDKYSNQGFLCNSFLKILSTFIISIGSWFLIEKKILPFKNRFLYN